MGQSRNFVREEEGPKYYNEVLPDPLNVYWKNLYDQAIDFIPSKHDVAIADLGCGPGRFAEFLYKKGFKNYWGVDFAEVCINIAKELVPEFRFITGSLYDKKIQAEFEKYNVFISLQVFEHLKKDCDVIAAIPKESCIIFSVPTAGGRGHIRRYITERSVIKRYKSLIKFKDIRKIQRHKGCFWLACGIKR